MKMGHARLITFSGVCWLLIGGMLLWIGLSCFNQTLNASTPLLENLAILLRGKGEAAVALIAGALFLGHFKGRYVLSKSAGRIIGRILALPNPASLSQVYSQRYLVLVFVMVGLGILLRFVPLDVRGFVDVAVGSALIQGSLLFFKRAAVLKNST